jgi:hypothetical protein
MGWGAFWEKALDIGLSKIGGIGSPTGLSSMPSGWNLAVFSPLAVGFPPPREGRSGGLRPFSNLSAPSF